MSKLIFNYGNDRIELDYGDSVTINTGGPDEEGYSYTQLSIVRDRESGIITAESYTRALDCDGRMDFIADFLVMVDITGTARFHKIAQSQRDYCAEAMGY